MVCGRRIKCFLFKFLVPFPVSLIGSFSNFALVAHYSSLEIWWAGCTLHLRWYLLLLRWIQASLHVSCTFLSWAGPMVGHRVEFKLRAAFQRPDATFFFLNVYNCLSCAERQKKIRVPTRNGKSSIVYYQNISF
jgi:hypothetical protein